MTDPIQTLWAEDASDARGPSPDALHARARRLRRSLWLRDTLEYGAALFVVIWFGRQALLTTSWPIQAACGLIILGTLMVAAGLWRRRERHPVGADADVGVAHLRARLVRQRDMLASVPRWYLGPLVPGVTAFVVAQALERARQVGPERATVSALIAAAVIFAVFAGVWWLNRRGARAFEQEIAALDRATTDGEGSL
jgi:hypothetical protein